MAWCYNAMICGVDKVDCFCNAGMQSKCSEKLGLWTITWSAIDNSGKWVNYQWLLAHSDVCIFSNIHSNFCDLLDTLQAFAKVQMCDITFSF